VESIEDLLKETNVEFSEIEAIVDLLFTTTGYEQKLVLYGRNRFSCYLLGYQ